MPLFIRTRAHHPWHIAHLDRPQPARHVTNYRTHCGKWLTLTEAEGATLDVPTLPEACRTCQRVQARREGL